MNDVPGYAPLNQSDWHKWLTENHLSATAVWLVFYKKGSQQHNLSWAEAVEEALCFGWIDGRRKPLDAHSFIQFFSQRKANSTWSKINKLKVEELIVGQRMMPAGFRAIEQARANGSWNLLDDVEDMIVPNDLALAFAGHAGTLEYYNSLSNSAKKIILQWVKLCKTDQTRQQRIAEIVNSAKVGSLPAALRR